MKSKIGEIVTLPEAVIDKHKDNAFIEQLKALPSGKAIKFNFNDLIAARTHQAGINSLVRYRKARKQLNITVKTVVIPENGQSILYVWKEGK